MGDLSVLYKKGSSPRGPRSRLSLVESNSPSNPSPIRPSAGSHQAAKQVSREQISQRFVESCESLEAAFRYETNPKLSREDAEKLIVWADFLIPEALEAYGSSQFPLILVTTASGLRYYDADHADLPTFYWAVEALFKRAFRHYLHLLPVLKMLPFLVQLLTIESELACFIVSSFCQIAKYGSFEPGVNILNVPYGITPVMCDLARRFSHISPTKALKFFNYLFPSCADDESISQITSFYGYMFDRGNATQQLLALRGFFGSVDSGQLSHLRPCVDAGLDACVLLSLNSSEKGFVEWALRIVISMCRHRRLIHQDALIEFLPSYLTSNKAGRYLLSLKLINYLIELSPAFSELFPESSVFDCVIDLLSAAVFEGRCAAAGVIATYIKQASESFLNVLVERHVLELLMPLLGDLPLVVASTVLELVSRMIASEAHAAVIQMMDEYRDVLESIADDPLSPINQLAANLLAQIENGEEEGNW
jgi:hypothetical protein